MPERQQPDRNPGQAPQGASSKVPQIETPVIDIQDLEHKPGPQTRVNNAGVKVSSQTDGQRRKDDAEAATDEEAREAVVEFECTIEDLPPQ